MIETPFIKHRRAAERKTGGGLIISVFQSGALKLPADCFVGLLLRFKMRGDFPAREDHFGETISPTSGDFDSNGIVNAVDDTIFRDNLGLDASVLNGNRLGVADSCAGRLPAV